MNFSPQSKALNSELGSVKAISGAPNKMLLMASDLLAIRIGVKLAGPRVNISLGPRVI